MGGTAIYQSTPCDRGGMVKLVGDARYDKVNRRIEIAATITDTIADALHNAKDLPEEVSNVAQKDIGLF